MRYFEDYREGEDETADEVYHITAEEIMEVGRRWDPQPFHIDLEAAKNSVFGGLVACSAHLFAIHTWFGQHYKEPIAVVTALGFTDIKLHAPVKPGDHLSERSRWISKRLSKSRAGCGLMEVMSELHNQNGELVFSVGSVGLVLCRPE